MDEINQMRQIKIKYYFEIMIKNLIKMNERNSFCILMRINWNFFE
jgi:hypothetical protein